MIDRLSVLCFAGTYALALAAELARFAVRGPVRWYLAAVLTALGWLVQTAYLVNLAIKSPMAPVATEFGSIMVLSWIVALIGLYLMIRSPRQVAVGMFVLPLVLGLAVGAGWFAPGNPTGSTGAGRSRSGGRCTGSSCWAGRSSRAWRPSPG